MKINSIAPNQTEVSVSDGLIFVSYSTPVAFISGGEAYRTDKTHSKTTSKHINGWLRDNGLNPANVPTKPQSWFDGLA